ncbi:MAG: 5-formyltetrahydrofolate cyclo-ligase [Schleiferilactobacillus perolens]|jgi:5-formyltetrahydrofolate cyclo-ligase|nr:5-formyltetrahydrofolate cyclo-ligase [Schleiferilactobacillus perolens]
MAEFTKTVAFKEESQRVQQKLLDYLSTTAPHGSVGLTMAGGIEVATAPIIETLLAAKRTVLLPKTFADRSMHFVAYHGDTKELAKTDYGILEPLADAYEVPDIIVVPGVAFVRDSHARVGFGAGYYDRYLAAHPDRATVAMATSVMTFAAPPWPVQPHDIPVQTLLLGEAPKIE